MKHLFAILLLAAAMLVCAGCQKSDTEKAPSEEPAPEKVDRDKTAAE